jgi:hypothetical protein
MNQINFWRIFQGIKIFMMATKIILNLINLNKIKWDLMIKMNLILWEKNLRTKINE